MKKTAGLILQSICCGTIVLVLLFSGHSCKKKELEVYTVTGRLLIQCNDTVTAKNIEIELGRKQGIMLFCKKRFDNVTAVTDGEGRFTFSYFEATCDKELSLTIHTNNSRYVRNIIPSLYTNRNIDLGNIYLRKNTPGLFIIETDTPYSSHIRLTYDYPLYDPNYYYNKITKTIYGPFTNNQYIDTGLASMNALLKEAPYLGHANEYRNGGIWRLYDTLQKLEIAAGTMYYDSIVQCKNYNKLIIKLR